MKGVAYSPRELMLCAASRMLRDGEVVFVGIGLPNIACNLARLTHTPRLVLIYESGAVGAVPDRLPISIGDPALVTGSSMICGMADVFQGILQRGRIDVGFLGGAQIDRFGNINTTVIGDYAHPRVRLPGSGGAAEIATHARRTLVIAPLDRRTFPARVDFVTSAGARRPGTDDAAPASARGASSAPRGRGPAAVITDRGVLEPDAETGELALAALAPGSSVDDVRAGVGWELRTPATPRRMAEPTAEELRVLRDVLRATTVS